MMLLAAILIALILYVFGRVLVWRLGWPTTVAAAGRWGLALLAVAVLLVGVPSIVDELSLRPPPATVSLVEFIVTVTLIGLGLLGYVAWMRGKELRAGPPERLQPRRRAAPPPPTLGWQAQDEAEDFLPAGGNDPFGNGQ